MKIQNLIGSQNPMSKKYQDQITFLNFNQIKEEDINSETLKTIFNKEALDRWRTIIILGLDKLHSISSEIDSLSLRLNLYYTIKKFKKLLNNLLMENF